MRAIGVDLEMGGTMATPNLWLAAALACGSPFILWPVLCLIARESRISTRWIVPLLSMLYWLTVFTSALLLLAYFVFADFPSSYAILSLGLWSGLRVIATWAVERFSPDTHRQLA